mmetsp:Transcript_25108/g.99012  ORF Transcript_25108/g.99012 Transcript_25108/m.99012 type:complete len:90 (-) Transcript_25108:1240-1509(-)
MEVETVKKQWYKRIRCVKKQVSETERGERAVLNSLIFVSWIFGTRDGSFSCGESLGGERGGCLVSVGGSIRNTPHQFLAELFDTAISDV